MRFAPVFVLVNVNVGLTETNDCIRLVEYKLIKKRHTIINCSSAFC